MKLTLGALQLQGITDCDSGQVKQVNQQSCCAGHTVRSCCSWVHSMLAKPTCSCSSGKQQGGVHTLQLDSGQRLGADWQGALQQVHGLCWSHLGIALHMPCWP